MKLGLVIAALMVAAVVSGIAAGYHAGVNRHTVAPQPTVPNSTLVTAYNSGFEDGMQNAHDIGPAAVTKWLNAQ